MATASIVTRSIQGESLSASADRLINTVLLNEGVVNTAGNSYKVAQDTGSNMQVKVGSGSAFDRAVVAGDVAGQGTFILEHQNATQNLTIAASDPSNPRIDGIDLVVKDDTFDSSGLDESDLVVTQGTPAGSPSAPAVPSSAIRLATVLVGAGVTAITNGNITDARVEALVNETALSLSSRVGQWQSWTPTLTNLTLGNGTRVARYTQIGKTVIGHIHITFGSSSSMGTNPQFSAPVAASTLGYASLLDSIGTISINDSGTAQYVGGVRFVSGNISPFVFGAGGTHATLIGISSTVPMTWTTNDSIMIEFEYEAA